MKKQYRFEIVRRGDDRYYWLFVVLKGRRRRRRRVLARSARDYRSSQKAKQAIGKLRCAADIFDTTYALPRTRFRTVSGVVPLIVEEFPVVDREAQEFHAVGRARNDSLGEETGEPVATTAATEQPAATTAAAKPSIAPARKPAPRRRSRAKQAPNAPGGEPSASQ